MRAASLLSFFFLNFVFTSFISPVLASSNACLSLFSNQQSILPFNVESLKTEGIPYSKFPFENLETQFDVALKKAQEEIREISENPETPTFENTVLALDNAGLELSIVSDVIGNFASYRNTDAVSELAQKTNSLGAEFSTNIFQNEKLYERVEAVYKNSPKLNAEQKLLTENFRKSFLNNGFGLSKEKKERFVEIVKRLSILSQQFSKNVLDSTKEFEHHAKDIGELKGLPKDLIKSFRENAEKSEKSGYVLKLSTNTYLSVLNYAENRTLRETIFRAFSNRGNNTKYDNKPVIQEILKLKHELSEILGKETTAHRILEERMAKDPETVSRFLMNIVNEIKPLARTDLAEIRKLAYEDGIIDLKPWDVSYYSEKLKNKKTNFDSQVLRQYFEINKVKSGLFDFLKELYGIRFIKIENADVWHSDVEYYRVQEENGELIGHIYMDLYSRTGTKREGAWMNDNLPQGLFMGSMRRPHVSITMNIQKTADKTLLSFNDVETLFHEMGHALHGLFSNVTYTSLSGTNVKWDFVELPSQIMENFLKDRRVLDMVSEHVDTKAKIPDELYSALLKSERLGMGLMYLRQVSLGLIDMGWHNRKYSPDEVLDLEKLEIMAKSHALLMAPVPGVITSTNFSHIFSDGYTAGYYSYLWAEALDKDAYNYFRENGTLNRQLGEKFRREILEKGGTQDPTILYQNFRGQTPDPQALINYIKE